MVRKYARVTTNLARDEAREVDKLCEVCVEFFRHSALSFVADAQSEPSVFSYSCDGGIPLRTQKYVREGGLAEE